MIRLHARCAEVLLRPDTVAWRSVLALGWILVTASPSVAQVFVARPLPQQGSVEISGGGVFVGGKALPDVAAALTRNPGTGTGPLELFQSEGTLTSAFGAQVRVGAYVSPRIIVEGGVQYARPKVEVRLSGDFEEAETTTASETITSYLFTGSVLYHFGRPQSGFRPFVVGGGGHVRDVHEGNSVVDTGAEFHAGGGFKWWVTSGRRNRLGLRGDVTASVRGGGVGAEDDRRVVPSAAISLAYLF